MKDYIVVYKQLGEGCDYTINCGIDIRMFSGDTIDEIKEIVEDRLIAEYGDRIGMCEIHEISKSTEININEIYSVLNDDVDSLKEAEELMEYERLKRKYDK